MRKQHAARQQLDCLTRHLRRRRQQIRTKKLPAARYLPQAQQAANEALAGVNNIGGYMCFINVKYANYAAYGSYTIIGNHCFH